VYGKIPIPVGAMIVLFMMVLYVEDLIATPYPPRAELLMRLFLTEMFDVW
jgi:hypothetical protein